VAVAPVAVVEKRDAIFAPFFGPSSGYLSVLSFKKIALPFHYLKNKILQVRRYLYLKIIPIILNTDSRCKPPISTATSNKQKAYTQALAPLSLV
jgi:hypothetical protein